MDQLTTLYFQGDKHYNQGIKYVQNNKIDSAIKYYNKALADLQQVANNETHAYANRAKYLIRCIRHSIKEANELKEEIVADTNLSC